MNYYDTILFTSFSHQASLRHEVDAFLKSQDERSSEALFIQLSQGSLSTSSKRYRFVDQSSRGNILQLVFQNAFEANQEQVIRMAQLQAKQTFYPLWKRVVWIKAPELMAAFFKNKLVQCVAACTTVVLSGFIAYKVYHYTAYVLAAKVFPFIINHALLTAIHLYNQIVKIADVFYNRLVLIVFSSWLLKIALERLPTIPYVTAIKRYLPDFRTLVFFLQRRETFSGFIVNTSIKAFLFGFGTCSEISHFFKDIRDRSELVRVHVSNNKAYQTWLTVLEEEISKQHPPVEIHASRLVLA